MKYIQIIIKNLVMKALHRQTELILFRTWDSWKRDTLTSSALSLWRSRTTRSCITMEIQVLMNSKTAWKTTTKNSRCTSNSSNKSSNSNSKKQQTGLVRISREEESTRKTWRLTIRIFRRHLAQYRELMNCNNKEQWDKIKQQLKATCSTITKDSWIKLITWGSKEKNYEKKHLFIRHFYQPYWLIDCYS